MNTHQTNSGMTNFLPAQAGVEINVGNSVQTIPTASIGQGRGALVAIKANSIRVTFDGTDPASAGAGFIFAAGVYYWSREMCERARMIESVGGSAAVVRVEAGS